MSHYSNLWSSSRCRTRETVAGNKNNRDQDVRSEKKSPRLGVEPRSPALVLVRDDKRKSWPLDHRGLVIEIRPVNLLYQIGWLCTTFADAKGNQLFRWLVHSPGANTGLSMLHRDPGSDLYQRVCCYTFPSLAYWGRLRRNHHHNLYWRDFYVHEKADLHLNPEGWMST